MDGSWADGAGGEGALVPEAAAATGKVRASAGDSAQAGGRRAWSGSAPAFLFE